MTPDMKRLVEIAANIELPCYEYLDDEHAEKIVRAVLTELREIESESEEVARACVSILAEPATA